jgi:conjugal transfer/entry exclusion protein
MKKIILTAFLLLAALTARSTLPVFDYSSVAQQIAAGLRQVQQLTNEINSYQTLLLISEDLEILCGALGHDIAAEGSLHQFELF